MLFHSKWNRIADKFPGSGKIMLKESLSKLKSVKSNREVYWKNLINWLLDNCSCNLVKMGLVSFYGKCVHYCIFSI